MSDIIHEVKLEYNGFKLEIKGERDFIDEKIGDMGGLLEKILSTPKITDSEKSQALQLTESSSSNVELIPSCNTNKDSVTLRGFLNDKGFTSDIDVVLAIAYYLENYCDSEDFSKIDIEEKMREARYPIPKNTSKCLFDHVKKDNIQESKNTTKRLKRYCLTERGIKYINDFRAPDSTEKHIKSKKQRVPNTIKSTYECLAREELNLDKYPRLVDLDKFKDKMVLAMYVISAEGKGNYFTVNDICYILLNIFGEKATIDQVGSLLRREPDWFNKDTSNKKAIKYKLLSRGEEYSKKIIAEKLKK